jgi:hypothetical protein
VQPQRCLSQRDSNPCRHLERATWQVH